LTRVAIASHLPPQFDQDTLEAVGFAGFLSIRQLRRSLADAPLVGGVYVVVRLSVEAPHFRVTGSGGRFKGEDPNVPLATLRAKWVPRASVVYIGKAGSLSDRVASLIAFGAGHAVGHRGGRYLWQLADAESLLVAWRPEAEPERAEAALLDAFRVQHGMLPFANLRAGWG
jgi:hypothetical protein